MEEISLCTSMRLVELLTNVGLLLVAALAIVVFWVYLKIKDRGGK